MLDERKMHLISWDVVSRVEERGLWIGNQFEENKASRPSGCRDSQIPIEREIQLEASMDLMTWVRFKYD